MKPSEELKAARQLITPVDKWIKDNYMVEVRGVVCYCSLGALNQIHRNNKGGDFVGLWDTENSPAVDYLRRAVDGEIHSAVPIYNDTHTHTEVLEMFDKAIVLAEAAGE